MPSSARRIVALTMALCCALAVLLIAPPPTSAHASLIGSSPSWGARLAEAPSAIELEFDSPLLPVGAAARVTGPDGTDWLDGTVTINRTNATIPVRDGMPAASYLVRWQLVAEDGHPMSGTIPFVIGDGPLLTEAPSASAPSASGDASTSDDGLGRTLLIGAVGAAIAGLAFAVVVFVGRRRRADTE